MKFSERQLSKFQSGFDNHVPEVGEDDCDDREPEEPDYEEESLFKEN
jgi:hypothetical protein